ncbi:MAG: hypothetical protein KAR06_04195 [Deltaproteobacteria bacterium]|nr:hypothetical protein [Deltaproteobacteria bacterium]
MTAACGVGQLNRCRICTSHRYEVQIKDGDVWVIKGYTPDPDGAPLKYKLEAEGKEVRVIDTEDTE